MAACCRRRGYRTIGVVNAATNNAILVPYSYTGTDEKTELYFCGPQRALNPDKYLIILTKLLANGVSSSTANTGLQTSARGFRASRASTT